VFLEQTVHAVWSVCRDFCNFTVLLAKRPCPGRVTWIPFKWQFTNKATLLVPDSIHHKVYSSTSSRVTVRSTLNTGLRNCNTTFSGLLHQSHIPLFFLSGSFQKRLRCYSLLTPQQLSSMSGGDDGTTGFYPTMCNSTAPSTCLPPQSDYQCQHSCEQDGWTEGTCSNNYG